MPDNFLFVEENGKEIRLIDWEYAGRMDIAMFCIYSLYKKEQVDLIDLFILEETVTTEHIKIYCYIAVCGLLW